jgi:hypothetical protein
MTELGLITSQGPLLGQSTPSGKVQIVDGCGSKDSYLLIRASDGMPLRYVPSSQAQTIANTIEANGVGL